MKINSLPWNQNPRSPALCTRSAHISVPSAEAWYLWSVLKKCTECTLHELTKSEGSGMIFDVAARWFEAQFRQ